MQQLFRCVDRAEDALQLVLHYELGGHVLQCEMLEAHCFL